MARWAKDHADRVGEADPAMPDGILNRKADNLRPLLAIADAAGGEWPERARKAAEASHNAEGDDAPRLELLLADIRDAFAKEGEAPVANMFAEKVDVEILSADLVKALVAIVGRDGQERQAADPEQARSDAQAPRHQTRQSRTEECTPQRLQA